MNLNAYKKKVFKTRELKGLAILKWGAKRFHPLKVGSQNILPCLEGEGVQKGSDP